MQKKLIAPLIEECTKTVEEVKLAKITLAENENSCKCSSCRVYIVLLWIFFPINIGGIGAYSVYFHWYLKTMLLVKQQSTKLIKWVKSNKLTLKIELIIFTTT